MTRASAIIVVMFVALPVIGLELPPLEDLASDQKWRSRVVKLTQDEKQAW